MSEKYVMPEVEVGMPVYWYDDAHNPNEPQAAIVTAIGHQSIAVNILSANTMNMRLRDGVVHVTDPKTQRTELSPDGAWDFTPWMKRFKKMEAALLSKFNRPEERK